jgi:hypothetical protein
MSRARNGWSHLVVTLEPARLKGDELARARPFAATDGSTFPSEREMLGELGATGWELVCVRDSAGAVIYYFKRPRA